jgi:hypothetical protein
MVLDPHRKFKSLSFDQLFGEAVLAIRAQARYQTLAALMPY